MIVIYFLKVLLMKKKNDAVKVDKKVRANEQNVQVIYGCIRFIESYRIYPAV